MVRKAKAKPRILVADDDPEILSLLTMRLRQRGYDVVEAHDGDKALEVARAKKPDLVLLDVMMPQKNGWEVARELKQDAATKEIGIVMLTAIGATMNELTSPLYGADAYVDKPFEFDSLEKTIAGVLEKRAAAAMATP
jgi:DNA-binding response OmpR family regulator